MKIVAIGDIHGRTIWKNIVKKYNNDVLFIFIGDYLDQYSDDISNEDAFKNLEEIIEFKKTHNVILLLGNHDTHYFYNHYTMANRIYEDEDYKYAKKFFLQNLEHFQMSYQVGNYLFTHAGISIDWLNAHREKFNEYGLLEDYSNIGDIINKISRSSDYLIFDELSYYRKGYHLYGSLLWADKRELVDNYVIGLKQIAGHNKVRTIIKSGDFESYIWFIDCFSDEENVLIIDTDKKWN